MKVAILVDDLTKKGGIQRIVLAQAKYFNADIYTGKYNSKTTFEGFKSCKINQLLNVNLPRRVWSLILRLKFKKLKLRNYDFYIFHGGASLEAAKRHKPNLWYCHSPSRYLYDLYKDELKKFKGIKKILFLLISWYLRKRDQSNVRHINKILTNSKNVQNRVKKFYKRDSLVLYPFVDLKKFRWLRQDNFYLSPARLDPIKRVDLLVKAFQKMPRKRLIIVGTGPEYRKIKAMAKGYENIKLLGWVSEKKLRELYGSCIATFSVSYKEDFGLIPIESMACGKPCIATNSGGHLETIIHKKTGLLINPTKIENIINAVKWMTPERAKRMRKSCEERAKRFSKERFFKYLKREIKKSTGL